jgi:hypothetical protein
LSSLCQRADDTPLRRLVVDAENRARERPRCKGFAVAMSGDHRDLRVYGQEITAPISETSRNVVGHPTRLSATVTPPETIAFNLVKRERLG